MNLLFTDDAWEDYLYWQTTDKQIKRTPFTGTGKPEPLKHRLQGCWSRRINAEHRLVYEIQDNIIKIIIDSMTAITTNKLFIYSLIMY